MLQSEFQHVLHTNYAPTEAEAQKIKDYCLAPESEAQNLELEASRLETALNAVRLKQDVYQDAVTAHRALLSPIRRLSSEMLQTVFAFCIAEFPVMHASESPLLLGRVCKSWRDIVYDTAELWSGVHVVIPSGMYQLLRREALREWIARSKDYPLRISFYADHTSCEIEKFLDLIVPHKPRWEQITFTIPTNRFNQLADSFSDINDLPHLRSFSLSTPRPLLYTSTFGLPPVSPDSINPLRLLEVCTSLNRVSVHVIRPPHRSTLPSSIAGSLQELDVDYQAIFGFDLNELFNFIASCKNLRISRIRSSFKSVTATQPSSFITLPALEYLSADMHTAGFLVDPTPGPVECPALVFVDHLVTPKLLHLDLKNVLYVEDVSLRLVNLFSRSSCSLRSLSLRLMDNKHNLQPLLSFLEYATDITELRVESWKTDPASIDVLSTPRREPDAFLLGLAYTDTSTNYCPNLTRLILGAYSMGIDVDSLMTLVRSRLNPPPGCSRLQTLDLRGLSPPRVLSELKSFEASLLMKELCAQGLTILLPECKDPPGLSLWTGLVPWDSD